MLDDPRPTVFNFCRILVTVATVATSITLFFEGLVGVYCFCYIFILGGALAGGSIAPLSGGSCEVFLLHLKTLESASEDCYRCVRRGAAA